MLIPRNTVILILMCLTPLPRSCAALANMFRRVPPLQEELGCSPTLSRILGGSSGDDSYYYFDPLNLATDDNFATYRECELKHGRICMLATIGMVAPHLYAQVLQERISFLPKIPSSSIAKTALEALEATSVLEYVRILVTCAFLEAFVFVQRKVTDMPGDYGTGYFRIRDKGENERSLESELENGRLAMLAFAVQIVSEAVTGKNVVEQWGYTISKTSAAFTSALPAVPTTQ